MGSKLYAVYTEEARLLKDTCDFLDLIGATYTREMDATRRGVSDIIACYCGQYVALELKDDTGTPSHQQIHFLEKVIKAGGWGAVCRTLWDVAHVLDFCISK